MKIRGNTVGTTTPRPDWDQTNPNRADYIKNKPNVVEQVEYSGNVRQLGSDGKCVGEVYAVLYNGEQSTLPVSNQSTPWTLPWRDQYANFYVGAPVFGVHAANKQYVDDLVGNIETALDSIIAIQESLIGGVAE